MSWFVFSGKCSGWSSKRPKLSQSHVIFLVLVLLVLARGFRGVHWLLFDDGAIGLRRVADVVAALVHVVRALVPVPVFVHSVEQDEDTKRRRRHDADHHPRRAAGLPEDLGAWVSLRSSASGIGCRGDRDMITTNRLSLLSFSIISSLPWLELWWRMNAFLLCTFGSISQFNVDGSRLLRLKVHVGWWDWLSSRWTCSYRCTVEEATVSYHHDAKQHSMRWRGWGGVPV